MKAIVSCSINYTFECDIPAGSKDIVWIADCADPIYGDIVKLLTEDKLNYDSTINSVVDSFTGEVLYVNKD